MRWLEFYKLQASGNDFILLDSRNKAKAARLNYRNFAKKYCQRKTGIGADGLLVIQPSKKADFRMRIINADGSEAEMCGNGARCVGLWAKKIAKFTTRPLIRFETTAGIISARLTTADTVKVKTTDPFGLRLNMPLAVLGRNIHVNYINTGVPHVVIFVQGLDDIQVDEIGRAVRFHRAFAPEGANVNFVEIKNNNLIAIRTYERGLEAETFACGTGSIACAIVAHYAFEQASSHEKIRQTVLTKSGACLKVYFQKRTQKISDVWIEGEVCCVYRGLLAM